MFHRLYLMAPDGGFFAKKWPLQPVKMGILSPSHVLSAQNSSQSSITLPTIFRHKSWTKTLFTSHSDLDTWWQRYFCVWWYEVLTLSHLIKLSLWEFDACAATNPRPILILEVWFVTNSRYAFFYYNYFQAKSTVILVLLTKVPDGIIHFVCLSVCAI